MNDARPWILLAVATAMAALPLLLFRLLAAHLPTPATALGGAALDAGVTAILFLLLGAIALAGMRQAGLEVPGLGERVPAMAGVGAAVGLGTLLAALLDAGLAGEVRGVAGAKASAFLLGMGTLAVVLQAAAEELFFRGWLQRGLARDWPRTAAVGVAALLFALLHLLGGARSPLSILNLLLGGVLFGSLRERTGGLAAPIAAHAMYNWLETLVFGLDPNPGASSFGALSDLDLVGTGLWGGSSEGLNASLGLTLALLAAVLPLVATWPVRRQDLTVASTRP